MLRDAMRAVATMLAVITLISVVGCSTSEPVGTVSGSVTLDGQPVEAGVVTFLSSDGYAAMGDITGGQYALNDGLPPGNYKVSVSPPALTEAPGAEGDSAELPESPVPAGYHDEMTTDILKDVSEGANTIDIELTSPGPAVP